MDEVVGLRAKVSALEQELERKSLELENQSRELREIKTRYSELRHRIRNDLQGLMVLLSMQDTKDPKHKDCKRCVLRLSSASELHDILDSSDDATVSMSTYLHALSALLRMMFDDRVAIVTNVEQNAHLSGDVAQTIGLIYAEATMNALKHAFSIGKPGTLETRFRRTSDGLELTVRDDGEGFDPLAVQPGSGIELMRHLATQLKGRLDFERQPDGMIVRLTLPNIH